MNSDKTHLDGMEDSQIEFQMETLNLPMHYYIPTVCPVGSKLCTARHVTCTVSGENSGRCRHPHPRSLPRLIWTLIVQGTYYAPTVLFKLSVQVYKLTTFDPKRSILPLYYIGD